jgi:hypothetical protein
VSGDDLLAQIENTWPKLGIYLRTKVIPSIETTAQNAGVSSSGNIDAPPPPESVNVTTSGEYMQIVVNHSAAIQKGIQYISHISTNPQFSQPIVHDHGSSRSPVPFPLPTKDASGNPISYYVRTIAQYPGSHPSAPTYYGGSAPTAVTLSGSTQMNLLPTTGSGTGSNNGQQSLAGLGSVQFRPAPQPKRSV